MQKRPTSVAIIAWWLIGSSILAIVVNILASYNAAMVEVMSRGPMPLQVRFTFIYAAAVVSVAAGAGLLKGRTWARSLYIGWSILSFIISFAISVMKTAMVPGLVIFGVIVYLLFRPEAKEFFERKEAERRSAAIRF